MDIDVSEALPAEPVAAAAAAPARLQRPSLAAWLGEGARTLLLRRPRWDRLETGPAFLTVMVVLGIAAAVLTGRLEIAGDARFYWRAGLSGWAAFMLTALACYMVRPRPDMRADSDVAPAAAHLLTMTAVQSLLLQLSLGLADALARRAGLLDDAGPWLAWIVWLLPTVWVMVAMLVLLMRHGDRVLSQRVQACYVLCAAAALNTYFAPVTPFWQDQAPEGDDAYKPLSFSQELVEQQLPLMEAQLDALAPQRPGVADMYTITFAPYEGEEVFRRESGVVNEVMARRFDAAGRGLRMINHREHLDNMPWATPINLQRAIEGIAETMDRDEDVLFIHLTSHGASDGQLATSFWPLDVAAVEPPDLKKWLDDAGIRHRVISISACYAGAWVAPLAGPDTLVMTASDADHTSYGCGKKSPLTFFGRAMYDEQLRTKTRSFAQAHAAARLIIDQREKEAGKSDGYSNPQISMGERIGPYLEKLRARLESQP
jgi:hypothetical protein